MRFNEWLRKKTLAWLGLEHLSENPSDTRLTFIGDDDRVWHERVQEYGIWYEGDSDKLQEYYLGGMAGKWATDPIANRAKPQYFWGIAVNPNERVKKTHSGVPRMIVDTLTNIVDTPTITISGDDEAQKELHKILKFNNFSSLLTQQGRAMTLVEGWGAYKININKQFSDMPTIQYYKAQDVDYIYKDNVLIGIVFKDYYRSKDDKDYLLCETRFIDGNDSCIKFELFRKHKNDLGKCELKELPDLNVEDIRIPNYRHILAVPSIYFYDQFHLGYGRSIYTGKLDVFDDLDQCLSQASTSIRYSTPIEYVNAEFLQRGPNGEQGRADVFCRRYIMLEGEMDSDGKSKSQAVTVTQPEVNTTQYSLQYTELLKVACSGILAATNLGINDVRVSNANSDREREKVTIMTRNNMIAKEGSIIQALGKLLLDSKELIDTGSISDKEYKINVKYNDFANPTFENELRVLGNAWSMGQISTENYIKLLWKGKLSADAMLKEAKALERNKNMKYSAGGSSGFNQYNEQEKADADAGDTDGISDNPDNQ